MKSNDRRSKDRNKTPEKTMKMPTGETTADLRFTYEARGRIDCQQTPRKLKHDGLGEKKSYGFLNGERSKGLGAGGSPQPSHGFSPVSAAHKDASVEKGSNSIHVSQLPMSARQYGASSSSWSNSKLGSYKDVLLTPRGSYGGGQMAMSSARSRISMENAANMFVNWNNNMNKASLSPWTARYRPKNSLASSGARCNTPLKAPDDNKSGETDAKKHDTSHKTDTENKNIAARRALKLTDGGPANEERNQMLVSARQLASFHTDHHLSAHEYHSKNSQVYLEGKIVRNKNKTRAITPRVARSLKDPEKQVYEVSKESTVHEMSQTKQLCAMVNELIEAFKNVQNHSLMAENRAVQDKESLEAIDNAKETLLQMMKESAFFLNLPPIIVELLIKTTLPRSRIGETKQVHNTKHITAQRERTSEMPDTSGKIVEEKEKALSVRNRELGEDCNHQSITALKSPTNRTRGGISHATIMKINSVKNKIAIVESILDGRDLENESPLVEGAKLEKLARRQQSLRFA